MAHTCCEVVTVAYAGARMPELVTIEAVPIVRVGTYDLASGPRTFSEEDLQAAAQAWATDASVKNPRIKIDSLEKAMGLDPMSHGGEPAFGWADNLRVSANGQELLADFHVPDFIHAAMQWAYPSLSIEGTPPGWVSATGRSHELVITAVALLGVHWPGVTTLDDFQQFLVSGPAEGELISASAVSEVLATMPARRREDVTASLDSDMVTRRFIDMLDGGELELPDGVDAAFDLWPRSMRFGDDGAPYLKITDESKGTLYRVDFAVSGSQVTFGDFVEVVEQDVPVAAGAPRAAAPLASWASRADVRAALGTDNRDEEDPSMTDEQRRAIAVAYGLNPDTATEDECREAVANGAPVDEAAAADGSGEGEADQAVADAQVEQPVAARSALPEGVVMIDESELANLRAGARAGLELQAAQATAERDRTIQAAIREGRIAPARAAQWSRSWDADPEGTRHLLTAAEADGGLAANTIPVVARGVEPVGEVEAAASVEAAHDDYMSRYFPASPLGGGAVRIRTEA